MNIAMAYLVGLVLSGATWAEPVVEGQVRLSSGEPAVGARVLVFDLADLSRYVGATTDEAGQFVLSLGALASGQALPEGFGLGQNYPNPFNPATMIPYELAATGYVRLEVFNLLGQRVATLVDGEQAAGRYTAQWDARDAAGQGVAAGVYIYRLLAGGSAATRRMVLVDGPGFDKLSPSGAAGGGVGVRPAVSAGYGLTVSGVGLETYVDADFRVGAGPVEVVVALADEAARGKAAAGGILGDVNNDGTVDLNDALLVTLYSGDLLTAMPNNGDISLGDVNGDGQVDSADAYLIALYNADPAYSALPAGIGEPVVGEPVVSDDRAVLVALYEATDGANWGDNTNWLSEAPLYEWAGVKTDEEGRVFSLDLSGNRLTGSIPAELGQLQHLVQLVLYSNGLTGSIPAELGQLQNLIYLNLSYNGLTGSIPAELGQLQNLRVLDLYDNELMGSIPAELGQLQNLRVLDLSDNELMGSIPAELGQLQNLRVLDLSYNYLTGSIPAELGQLQHLVQLNLSDNELTGSIPAELGQLQHLVQLNLSDNELTGSIPAELGQLQNLIWLDLYGNELTGCIPSGLRYMRDALDALGLSFCR